MSRPTPRLMNLPRAGNRGYYLWFQFCAAVRARGVQASMIHDRPAVVGLARNFRRLRLIRPLAPAAEPACIVPVMWARDDYAFPATYRHRLILVCNDCWEPQFDRWERLFKRHRVEVAFITARIAGRRMAERVPGLNWHWMPEAIDPSNCDPRRPLAGRSIDLINFGRTLAVIRDRSAALFEQRGYVYRGGEANQWYTKNQAELYALLSDAKLAVCLPKTMTHFEGPYAAGCVETLTFRYLETIASGCLPYGHCPDELLDLFGFNPVIEADLDDPGPQLDEVIRHINDYQPLADRSLKRLHEVATWDIRIEQMFDRLREAGFDMPTADTRR